MKERDGLPLKVAFKVRDHPFKILFRE